MNTATIRYRVADFLSRHTPFQFVDQADLLALAGSGRVRFHEKDEYIFRQGDPRRDYVSVIQQGTVDLYEETSGGSRLRDRLGEGELLGIGRFVAADTYLYTAKTSGDVLLYRFPAEEFDRIADKYRQVADYLSAYFSARPSRDGRVSGVWGVTPADPVALRELSVRRLASVGSAATVRDVSAALHQRNTEAAVLLDSSKKPAGLVTAKDVIRLIADTGDRALHRAAAEVAYAPVTAAAGLEASEYALLVMRNEGRPVVLTVDGSTDSPAVGLVGADELSLLAGVNPALLAKETSTCENPQQIARIVQRSKALIFEALSEPARAEWCAQVVGELYQATISRLIEIAETEAADAGLERPSLKSCWVFFGGAGRRELLTWFDVDVGLILDDAPQDELTEASRWYSRVARRVDAMLTQCGFEFTASAVRVGDPGVRLTLSEWKQRFQEWVKDPTDHNVYGFRSFFDFHDFHGNGDLAERLRDEMLGLAAGEPRFLALLASDCLEQMPPVTFFEGLVVQDGGVETDILDIRRSAVFPIVDSARVFGLARGARAPGTFARLDAAAALLPSRKDAFEEAKEAYRVTLQRRSRAGLSSSDDGVHIRPGSLSKYEQQILKGAFRSIGQLIELTSGYFEGVDGR